MSTKIYDAYVWKGEGGVEGLLRKLMALRARVFKHAVTQAGRETTPEAFRYIEYMDDLRALIKSGMHFSDKGNYNPSASATVHLLKGQAYVMFFGLPREIKRTPFGGLRDFHYQNSCDKPNGVSDREWLKRERTWDEILKQDPRPSHSGFVFPIIEESDALRIAGALFERIHGHRVYDAETVIQKCRICVKRRAEWAAEQAKNKKTAEKELMLDKPLTGGEGA